ncbi:hypothetical protein NIES4073_52730 [Kalymmatonema gypsitolerans NIES-4073]|nr:hypothetical protein NIES4073_52730 [Scytonema sp. NIES-4073]
MPLLLIPFALRVSPPETLRVPCKARSLRASHSLCPCLIREQLAALTPLLRAHGEGFTPVPACWETVRLSAHGEALLRALFSTRWLFHRNLKFPICAPGLTRGYGLIRSQQKLIVYPCFLSHISNSFSLESLAHWLIQSCKDKFLQALQYKPLSHLSGTSKLIWFSYGRYLHQY